MTTFGLTQDEWRDLVLSVNVRGKNRRLSPSQVAHCLRLALAHTSMEELAAKLGFTDTTTLRRIAGLSRLSPDLASTVQWGTRRGCISMSTAAELLRLEDPTMVRDAVRAAIEHDLSREEARQVVQVCARTGSGVAESVQRALATRTKIERSELILGSLLSRTAQEFAAAVGDERVSRAIQHRMAARYPDIVPRALRVNGQRFSLLLTEADGAAFRSVIGSRSVEQAITELADEAARHSHAAHHDGPSRTQG